MKTCRIAVTLLFLAVSARGNSPATPMRHVVTSKDKFIFVMDPGNFSDVPAKGVAYKAKRNGFEKFWEISGWYGSPGELFLSHDGKTLVRIRSLVFSPTSVLSGEEKILFFYRRGKLKRSYSANELIQDLKDGTRPHLVEPGQLWVEGAKIAPSESYRIETNPEGSPVSVRHPDVFHLTTLEGVHFIFNLKNGELLARRVRKKKEEKPDKAEEVNHDPFADPEHP